MNKIGIKMVGMCALCKKENVTLEKSHIIPKFVTRRILKKSVNGYMRNPFEPNQRLQDGDKQYLLCGECEDRFEKVETIFAKKVFHPYKDMNQQSFEYEEWLNYFIMSVNWRNLYLDLEGFEQDKTRDKKDLEVLIDKERIIRDFLMGARCDVGSIENHMFFFEDIKSANETVKESEPHSYMRHSSFGYTFISHDYDGYYVTSNLSGILIFTLLKRPEIDIWEKTKLEDKGSYTIGQQQVKSPITTDVLELMGESREAQLDISRKQQEKIMRDLEKNVAKIPDSEIYKNRTLDKEIIS